MITFCLFFLRRKLIQNFTTHQYFQGVEEESEFHEFYVSELTQREVISEQRGMHREHDEFCL